MPVVKFDISPPLRSMKPLPLKGMHAARERGARCRFRLARWSGGARSGCAASARQNWNTGTDHLFRWKQQPVRLLAAGPQRSGRSQSCGDDGQSAFSDLQQDREIAVRSGSEQYALVLDLVVTARPIMPAIQSCFTINWPIAGFLPSLPQSATVLRVCRAFADQRSDWDLIFVGLLPPRLETIFPIIRKLECGRMPTTSARASSLDGSHICGCWRVCAGSRAGFGR